jgi:hypothetical protein
MYLYENKTMKSVEITLSRGGKIRQNNRGGESNEDIHDKHLHVTMKFPYTTNICE